MKRKIIILLVLITLLVGCSSNKEFIPTDVSNETISSINTYEDYLKMYEFIILDYISNYEEAIKDTVLHDEKTYQELKETYRSSFEEQREAYENMKDKKIVGKEEIVDFLIDYRDLLKDAVDEISKSLD